MEKKAISFRCSAEELKGKWQYLPEFLDTQALMKDQVNSFNDFVDVEIKKIVAANNVVKSKIDANFSLKYLDVRVGYAGMNNGLDNCSITPHECRLQNKTYSAPVVVDVEYTRGNEVVRRIDLPIGRLPIMLRSNRCVLTGKSAEELGSMKECHLDPGGYFIIGGMERMIFPQEEQSRNRMFVLQNSSDEVFCEVLSVTYCGRGKSKVVHKNGKFYVRHNKLSEDIPLCIVFRAMGIECNQEIAYLMGTQEAYVEPYVGSFFECADLKIKSQNSALRYIGARTKKYIQLKNDDEVDKKEEALNFLDKVAFCHVSSSRSDMRRKAVYVGLMVQRIIQAESGQCSYDDPDFYGNKQLELAGPLIAVLFEDLFRRLNKELSTIVDKNMLKEEKTTKFDIAECIPKKTITSGLTMAIATGNWSVQRYSLDRRGVTRVVSSLSYASAFDSMRRMTTQYEWSRKVDCSGSLQSSCWKTVCPGNAPKGEPCKVGSSIALSTCISSEGDAEKLVATLFDLGVEDVLLFKSHELLENGYYYVLVNGDVVGATLRPKEIVEDIRFFRQYGCLHKFVSAFLHEPHRCVYFSTEAGRVCKPYVLIEHGQPRIEKKHMDEVARGERVFDHFFTTGFIEYLDVNERNTVRIAMHKKDVTKTTTHLEIDPLTELGFTLGCIQYPHDYHTH
ncbi:DNA-directed RNA polymerase [Trichuris trichiura]|uniref:DNA-directed RNA polymerase n=1 Tax=Trichuris trichiura TaxID=36087 RepID=A0A077ZEQ3_TRITR|nr:DNA-directed RNA polymerase [Trichuris trichiura]